MGQLVVSGGVIGVVAAWGFEAAGGVDRAVGGDFEGGGFVLAVEADGEFDAGFLRRETHRRPLAGREGGRAFGDFYRGAPDDVGEGGAGLDLGGGGEDDLELGGAGEEVAAADDVIVDERVGAGEAAGEEGAVEGGDGAVEMGVGRGGGGGVDFGEPEAAADEGVGREGDAAAVGGPGDGGAADPGGAEAFEISAGGGGGGLFVVDFVDVAAGFVPGGEGGEAGGHFGAGGAGEGEAGGHGFAAMLERVGYVEEAVLGLAQEFGQAGGVGHELGSGAGGEDGEGWGVGLGGALGCAGLDDEVGVGAAGAEGAEAGAEREGAGPGFAFVLEAEGGFGKIDVGVGAVEGRHGDEAAVAHLEDDLGQAGDSGGGFEVADGGLGGAEADGLAGGGGAEGGGEPGDFDWVAEGGAGAVGLDIADGFRRDAGAGHGGGDDFGLGCGAGDGVAVGLAAVVGGPAADDGVDVVVVDQGLGEGFEDDGADAFAGDVAVAAFGEAAAFAVGRGEAALAEADVFQGVEAEVDAAGDGDVALAGGEGLAGEVDGGEGGGAGGVDGHAGAVEVEHVGDAVGDGPVGGCAADGVAAGVLVSDAELVVAVHDAGVDAGFAAGSGEAGAGVAGVFEGFPADFEEEAFLGVHAFGFAGGYGEEEGVEVFDVGDEAAPCGVALAGGVADVFRAVPAGGRDFLDAVCAGAEVFPEGFEGGGVGEAAGEADDGDGGFGWGAGGAATHPRPLPREGGGKGCGRERGFESGPGIGWRGGRRGPGGWGGRRGGFWGVCRGLFRVRR